MKRYGILAGFAFLVLALASIWLGGLNQDEGWYLYAANLVNEGKLPYRDFFFTQGPLLPIAYSVFCGVWQKFGLIGARIITSIIGLSALIFTMALARLLTLGERKGAAALVTFLLLGSNIYHVYYTSIPKTYALGGFFLSVGMYLYAFSLTRLYDKRRLVLSRVLLFVSGMALAIAAGTRITLGAALAVAGVALLIAFKKYRFAFLAFGLGGALGLAVLYGPFILDPKSLAGLIAAQKYHAARKGFDVIFVVGSLSRLVRWYAPVFVLLGMEFFRNIRAKDLELEANSDVKFSLRVMIAVFLAIFLSQMAAPFPYEDYNVPIMGLLTVVVTVKLLSRATIGAGRIVLLALGMTWAASFGSPLLEKWTTNGHDRFWTLVKPTSELAQLQEVAYAIESIDPGGKTIFTQDLYLAIETNRKVPEGLEMGPFSMLSSDEWRRLITTSDAKIAAVSGYTFAINPPKCDERPLEEQLEFARLLNSRYEMVMKEEDFGQHATTLVLLKLREDEERGEQE